MPSLARFEPDFILISTGIYTHGADAHADLRLDEHDHAWATMGLLPIARSACGGRLVSTLEDAYSLGALATNAVEYVAVLLEGQSLARKTVAGLLNPTRDKAV